MHEAGILAQVVEAVEKIAEENQVSKIGEITLEIGELSGVLPVFMEKLFPVMTENHPLLMDTKLRLITVPGEGICNECEAMYNIMAHEGRCPVCGSRDKTIIGGQEFVLKSVTVAETSE